VTAFQSPTLANPDLKWETTISRNLGVDAVMFNNRFGFTVDVYSNKTKNLLVATPIPTNTGYTSQLQNVGSTTNRGVEVQLTATVMQRSSFQWTANFNISFNQNKVTDLGPQLSYLQNSNWAGSGNPSDFIVKVGPP